MHWVIQVAVTHGGGRVNLPPPYFSLEPHIQMLWNLVHNKSIIRPFFCACHLICWRQHFLMTSSYVFQTPRPLTKIPCFIKNAITPERKMIFKFCFHHCKAKLLFYIICYGFFVHFTNSVTITPQRWPKKPIFCRKLPKLLWRHQMTSS